MTKPSTRFSATLSAVLLLCFISPGAWASDRVETVASVTIVRSAGVTVVNNVVNNASLQTLLLTAAIAPVGVVFTASNNGRVTVGAAGGRQMGSGGAAGIGGAGLAAADGGSAAGLIAFDGSLTGTTIDGDAVSVSVGAVSGGSAPSSASVSVVIAQYN